MIRYCAEKVFKGADCFSNKNVAIKPIVDLKNESLHDHDFVEIVYIRKGSGIHFINGRQFPVKEGDCLYINYGCTHAFNVNEQLVADNLMIKVDYFCDKLTGEDNIFTILALTSFDDIQNELDNTSPLVSFKTGDERTRIESILDQIKNELKNDFFGKDKMIDSFINILLTSIFRTIFIGGTENEHTISKEVMNYIKEHSVEKLTLADVSQKSFYNPSYFSRLFKKTYNKTFTEFVLDERLKKSVSLLTTTKMSVEEIAMECGFSDKTAFYGKFKSKYGLTPGEYRKNNGKNG